MNQPHEPQLNNMIESRDVVAVNSRRPRKIWLIWSIISLCVIGIIIIITMLLRQDYAAQEEGVIVKESATKRETYSPMSIRKDPSQLTYGKWTGDIKYGQPHGNGTLTYTHRRLVSQFDTKGNVAEPGDYVIGEFDSGQLVSGRLYRTNGKVVDIVVTLPQ